MSIRSLQHDFRFFLLTHIQCTRVLGRVVRLSQFLADLNRKTGPLLDCNDTLIDGAVNEMFGQLRRKPDGEIHSFHNFEFIHNFELQIIQTIANICVVTADDQT